MFPSKTVVGRCLHELSLIAAVSLWVTAIVVSLFLSVSAVTLPVFYPGTATYAYLLFVVSSCRFWACLYVCTFQVLLTAVPLEWGSSLFARRLVLFATTKSCEYFSARVLLKDASALRPDKTYILGKQMHFDLFRIPFWDVCPFSILRLLCRS